jgi:hypothetical protein
VAETSLIFRILAQDDTKAGVEEASSSLGAFGGVLKGILGAEAIQGIGEFFSSAISLADQATKVTQQTAAILTSTGDAAGLTAAQVQNLAEKYGELAGVESTQVQNAMNSLLRSTGVQQALASNSVTADGLTSTLVNMAAAMSKGGSTADSLTGAASALSKALADPYTAAKALTAAGDPLTASQVAQIAAFKKAGDEADAYKLILGSLASATTGAAAANTTPLQQLGVKFDDLKLKIGQDLITPLMGLANLGLAAFGPITSAAQAFFGFLGSHITIIASLAGGIGAVVVGMKIWEAATLAVRGAWILLDAIVFANPIVLAIGAAVTAVIFLATKFQGFRDFVVAAIQDVMRVIGDLAQTIVNYAIGPIEGLLKLAADLPFGLGGPFKTAANAVDNFRTSVDNAISAVQNLSVAAGASALGGMLQSLENYAGSTSAGPSFNAGAALGTSLGSGLASGIGSPSAAAKGATAVQNLQTAVQNAIDTFKTGIVNKFSNMGSVISNAMTGPPGSNFLLGNLQAKLNQAKIFVQDIAKLRAMGASNAVITELVTAGPEQGFDAAQQLIGSGMNGIAAVNATESQLSGLANSFANTQATADFSTVSAVNANTNKLQLTLDLSGVSNDALVTAIRTAVRKKGGNVQLVLGAGA